MVTTKAIMRSILSISLASLLAVSPLCADIKNTQTYIVDLYNAKKNDGWTCYFWKSDAEDQAIKAGKACGETEASLYCRAAEYAEELQDEPTAKSLKQAYANGQLTMGPLGLAAAAIFMGCCARYIDDKCCEEDKLRGENRRLQNDIKNMQQERDRKQKHQQWRDNFNKQQQEAREKREEQEKEQKKKNDEWWENHNKKKKEHEDWWENHKREEQKRRDEENKRREAESNNYNKRDDKSDSSGSSQYEERHQRREEERKQREEQRRREEQQKRDREEQRKRSEENRKRWEEKWKGSSGTSSNGGTSSQFKTKRQQALDDLNQAIREVNGKTGQSGLKLSELTAASAKGDIEKAFRLLGKHYHPDKFLNDPAARANAEITFKNLGNARDELVGNKTTPTER